MKSVRTTLWVSVMSLVGTLAVAQDDFSEQAQRLATLRTDVEALSETLELEQEALRNELRTKEMRKAELEARIRQEEARLGELERFIERQREILASDEVAAEILTPAVQEGLQTLKASVSKSIPYRKEERLAAIDAVSAKLTEGTLDPRKGVSRLWQLIEDELRLTRENAVDRQTITTASGEEQLVQIGRVGMLALFTKADDGQVGYAKQDASGEWTWITTDDAEQVAQIDEFFDALSKQVRVGFFDLPFVLPEVTP